MEQGREGGGVKRRGERGTGQGGGRDERGGEGEERKIHTQFMMIQFDYNSLFFAVLNLPA